MCKWIDSLDVTSGPCVVSAEATAVDITMQTSRSEAGEICKTLAGTLRNDGVKFDSGWKLRIADSRGANNRLAECRL